MVTKCMEGQTQLAILHCTHFAFGGKVIKNILKQSCKSMVFMQNYQLYEILVFLDSQIMIQQPI